MQILFLGLLYNKERELEYINKSKVGLQGAINTFQWSLIDGLESVIGSSITIFNALPVGTYPSYYKDLILKSSKWTHAKSANDLEIGSINLPLLKQITRKLEFKRNAIEWIQKTPGKKVVIAYSLYEAFLDTLAAIKRLYPNVITMLIIPDLPAKYGILPKNKLLTAIQVYRGERMIRDLSFIDSFILLTKEMLEPLKVGNKPYTIIEGFVNNIESNQRDEASYEVNSSKKVILYTGTLHYQFGIKNLLDSFKLMHNANYELWICGSGEAEKEIINTSRADHRIKFLGYLSKKEIHNIQEQATILINPRPNEGKYTKYSFPSKTMEYMLSGKPVLMFKLDGVPDEYDKYVIYFTESSVTEMAKEIEKICMLSDEERALIGQKAKRFVLEEKNNIKQAQKIIDMINTI